MRILMVGNLGVKYIKDNWVTPLKKLYDANCVDIAPLINVYRNDFHEKYIYSIIREQKYEYLFIYTDGIHKEFSDKFFMNVKKAGVKTVAFHADDEPDYWYNINKQYDSRFDFVASHSKRGVQMRRKDGWGNRIIYLPWGFNPELFDRRSQRDKIYDIVYIGTNNIDHLDSGNCAEGSYKRDGFERQRYMVDLYNFCKNKGINFKIFGFNWDKHPILKNVWGGQVSQEEMVNIYNQAKIVFNPGLSADNDPNSYQTKLRHFEVAGCGAFQITNYNPELAELFEEDKSICFYRNEKELYDKILYYLDNEEARESVSNNSYNVAREKHTVDLRLKELFTSISGKSYKAIGRKNDINTLRIKQFYFSNMEEAEALFNELSSGNMRIEEYDFIHFIGGNIKVENIDYGIIKPFISDNVDMIGVRTFIQLSSLNSWILQRRKIDICGVILKDSNVKGNYAEYYELFKRNICAFENEFFFMPIMNYIISANKCKLLLKAYLDNDLVGLQQLNYIDSTKIINDVVINEKIAGMETGSYIDYLKKLVNRLIKLNKSVMIYGVRGIMAENVQKLLRGFSRLNLLGFIDRELAGTEYMGYRVYSKDDINEILPDIVIIAAEFSGVSIYKSIEELQAITTIVPLYDLNDSTWEVII